MLIDRCTPETCFVVFKEVRQAIMMKKLTGSPYPQILRTEMFKRFRELRWNNKAVRLCLKFLTSKGYLRDLDSSHVKSVYGHWIKKLSYGQTFVNRQKVPLYSKFNPDIVNPSKTNIKAHIEFRSRILKLMEHPNYTDEFLLECFRDGVNIDEALKRLEQPIL